MDYNTIEYNVAVMHITITHLEVLGMGPVGFNSFSIIDAVFPIFFIVVLGIIIFTIFKNIKQWNYNNHQPILTVDARVVSKRAHTSQHSHNMNDHMSHSTSTTYYTTFEFESRDRLELRVSSHEYGMLAEGDIGRLTFQGTRYHKFERI